MSSFEIVDTPLNAEMDNALQQTLHEGERVVWAGPRLARSAQRQSVFAFIFGLLFMGVAVFVVYALLNKSGSTTGSGSSRSTVGLIIAIPFALIGLFIMFSPLLIANRVKRTFYAITDMRALVVYLSKSGQTTTHEYRPDRLQSIQVREKADNSGSIIFEVIHTRVDDSGGFSTSRTFKGFIGVDNVRAVEKILHDTLLSTK